jgi:hypothetical protein
VASVVEEEDRHQVEVVVEEEEDPAQTDPPETPATRRGPAEGRGY